MKRTVLILSLFILSLPLLSQEKKGTALPDGYGDLTWGTTIKDARSRVKGKIVFTDDKQVIRTRDGNLEYHYGFLYLDKKLLPKEGEAAPEGGENKDQENDGAAKLFYVSLKYPYLAFDDIKKKVVERYGESTFENIKEHRGSIAWDSEKTIIILTVDNYEDKPFSRRLTYISKDISKELNQYMEKVFSKDEIEVLKKVTP